MDRERATFVADGLELGDAASHVEVGRSRSDSLVPTVPRRNASGGCGFPYGRCGGLELRAALAVGEGVGSGMHPHGGPWERVSRSGVLTTDLRAQGASLVYLQCRLWRRRPPTGRGPICLRSLGVQRGLSTGIDSR